MKQNISKIEAQQALDDISVVISKTQKAIASGPAAPLLMLWGCIWAIGYSLNHFFPSFAGLVWMILVLIGGTTSWLVGVKERPAVVSEHDGKIGLFWLVLFGYAVAWIFLLAPNTLPKGEQWLYQHPFSSKQIGAFFATVPMFAYVIGGLWFGRFFVWLGLLVTALTFAGYFLIQEYFYLWMAFTGGGSLITAGAYVRKFWK